MPPRSKDERFKIIMAALALAEERISLPLAEAADLIGVRCDELRELLIPVLYLEFHTTRGDLVNTTRGFYLDPDDDILRLDERHWIRDLVAVPPELDTALRLLVAGTVYKTVSTEPTPALDAALRKLDGVVDTEVVVTIDRPSQLPIVEEAQKHRRTLRCRYVNDRGESRDRELEPWFVFSNWGRWYVHGRDVTDDHPKWFRIDRMDDLAFGDRTFEPPDDFVIPERFDLSEHERTVRLRLPAAELDNLPTPKRVEDIVTLDDGRVEARVTVFGEQRLAHLLVVLPPEAEVVEPEYRDLRRTHAAKLLAMYDRGT